MKTVGSDMKHLSPATCAGRDGQRGLSVIHRNVALSAVARKNSPRFKPGRPEIPSHVHARKQVAAEGAFGFHKTAKVHGPERSGTRIDLSSNVLPCLVRMSRKMVRKQAIPRPEKRGLGAAAIRRRCQSRPAGAGDRLKAAGRTECSSKIMCAHLEHPFVLRVEGHVNRVA